ncbi:MAG: 4-(cytidine 5'-diphospho)-2-C-methyl-D-erythritol kinase [Lachnospiraceae bacterium]
MERLILNAMGKINLSLDVIRKREDNYHEVRMIMQTLNLYDTLLFEKTTEDGIVILVDCDTIPCDENNLIYKVTKMMFEQFRLKGGFRISLEKRIPMAAGMAGGSADAAATFVAINQMYQLNQSMDDLKKLAVKIGADVPYCLEGGTSLSEGIGEILTPLASPPHCYVLVVKPNISVSTKYVYENLQLGGNVSHPNVDAMIEAINKQDLRTMCFHMENILETVTVKKYPFIEEIKTHLREYGAINAIMSGSGPTVFGIFEDEHIGLEAKRKIEELAGIEKVVLTTFSNATCTCVKE